MENQTQWEKVDQVELRASPIDPNRAKYWSWGLVAVAALLCVLTIGSNYDYFIAYFDGWSLWRRLIVFGAIQAAIVLLPLAKGYGNYKQMYLALVFDVVLVIADLTHTYLVGGATQTRIAAERSRASASAMFDRVNDAASRAAGDNARLLANYNQELKLWRQAAADARYLGQPVPPMPQRPQLVEVPQVGKEVVQTAGTDIEAKVEAAAPHSVLLLLLYGMVGLVAAAVGGLVYVADGSRLRAWLLKQRDAQLKHQMDEAARVHPVGEPKPGDTGSNVVQYPKNAAGRQ